MKGGADGRLYISHAVRAVLSTHVRNKAKIDNNNVDGLPE